MTGLLVSLVAVVTAVGVWRLLRWYWRPRLTLADAPELRREEDGLEIWIEVRNRGAGAARRCRAELLRLDRWEDGRWNRLAFPIPAPGAHPRPGTVPAREAVVLRVGELLPPGPGRFRLELAVIDGEEVRRSYVVQVGDEEIGSPE